MSKSKKRKNDQRSEFEHSNDESSVEPTAEELETAAIPTLSETSGGAESSTQQTQVAPKSSRRRRTIMGREVTYVAQDKLLAVVAELGVQVEEKKAWLKVAGPSGARVYLPKRKEVGRVDIADFEAPEGTSVKLGHRSFGAVKEQLDMEGTEEQIMARFRAVLGHMLTLPPAEPKAKKDEPDAKTEGEVTA